MTTLGKVCKFLNGGTPSKAIESYFTGEIPWITSADMVGQIADFARSFITLEAVKNSATNMVPKGTVLLVTRTGVGKIAVAGMDLCFSQDITAIIPEPTKLDTSYLVQYLRTKQSHFERFARGATIKGITRDVVADLPILLPKLTEQRRIAAILDQADALRAKRRETLAQLDKLAQAIFVDMFGDPASEAPRFKKYALETMLARSFQNGAYFPKEAYCKLEGVEMIHMSDAFKGIVSRGELKRVLCSQDIIEKYQLNCDDLLIARRSITYDGAARPCMIPQSKDPLIFESSFIRITPDQTRIRPVYLFHYLNSDRIREKYVRPYVTQSTISGINQANLAQIQIMQPPLPLQIEFDKAVNVIEQMKLLHQASLTHLNTLFASLQHRAFRGEL